tara:strand:+ start:261 stop:1403 length:1143 start_codon:yes stop_codon:yes gene_type:complete
MLRIKRRRTRPRCLANGKIRYNTMNATGLEYRYVNQNTYLDRICQHPGCGQKPCTCNIWVDASGIQHISYVTRYKNDNSGNIINGCCKGVPYRNPILGYRKYLDCSYSCMNVGSYTKCSSNCELKPTNTIYKDPYAKTCGNARDASGTIGICYSPVIRKVQNRNGFHNDQYNYSFKQYLHRRCRSHKQQSFHFLSNSPVISANNLSHQYATGCHAALSKKDDQPCAIDCSNCIVGCDGQCNGQVKCAGYSLCDATNNNCCATYKPNNATFSRQGAVSGGSRINRLKYQTQLRAQSTYTKMDAGSSACQIKCSATPSIKNKRTTINAVNGSYPVTLYRDTYPTYKGNLSGFCRRNQSTCNGLHQRCHIEKKGMLCGRAVVH